MRPIRVKHVRAAFREKYRDGEVVMAGDEPGDRDMIELLDAQFVADQPTIYGKPNPGYVERELDWYMSGSLDVNDMEPPVPAVWKAIAASDGTINSNYGHLVFSEQNGNQFENCLQALLRDRRTRQACMIYQRPSMHVDATRKGARDFVCTYAVQCSLRLNFEEDVPSTETLHYSVFMRSNDAVFGYKNDLAWHKFVRDLLKDQLELHGKFRNLAVAPITWHAGSLHVYRRHFKLIAEDLGARNSANEREVEDA